MPSTEHLEYECIQCGLRQISDDALVSICPRCDGEMRNVHRIAS